MNMEMLEKMQNLPKIPADFFIVIVLVLCAITSYKRGLFKEGLIAVAYVPYVAIMFFLVNEFIQGKVSFDSMLYKCSAFGGLYIAYLFGVWTTAKILKYRLEGIDSSLKSLGGALAAVISSARTIYFLVLCIIFFNLHINQPQMLEKSKIAMALNPYALKTQKYLLSNSYIDNEITLYEDAANGTFIDGKYEHPLMKKMKNSERFKNIEKQIEDAKKQIEESGEMNEYLKRYGIDR